MRTAIDWKKGLDIFFAEHAQLRARQAVMLVLLVLLGALLAQLTWTLLPAGGQPSAEPPALQGGPVVAAPAVQRQWNIAQWHLFGEKPAEVQPGQVAVESLPETTLNLVLRGVMAASRPGEDSGAIIGAPNGVESFYTVGARLPGGATLKEVYPDRVVLERSGRLETLRLPKEPLDAPAAAQARRSPPVARAPAVAPVQTQVQERSLREYRDLALSNPQELAGMVNIAPRSEGGRVIGYEVQPGQDAGLLNRLGLMPGDVVTSINGISLDNPARAISVLRTLSGAEQVTVDVQRGGVPQSLSVSIQE